MEKDGGDGRTTRQMSLMPLDCTFKKVDDHSCQRGVTMNIENLIPDGIGKQGRKVLTHYCLR